MYRFAEINMSNVHSVVHFRGAFKVIPLVSSCFGPFKNITLYSVQHSADPVNREKGNITHIGLLEADEDKILVAQVSPKGSTCT